MTTIERRCISCQGRLRSRGCTPNRRKEHFECLECGATGFVKRDAYGRETYEGDAFEADTGERDSVKGWSNAEA